MRVRGVHTCRSCRKPQTMCSSMRIAAFSNALSREGGRNFCARHHGIKGRPQHVRFSRPAATWPGLCTLVQVIRWRARLRDAVSVRICARHHGVKLGLQHNCCHVGRVCSSMDTSQACSPARPRACTCSCTSPLYQKVVRTYWPLGRAYPYCRERTCGSEKQQRPSWFANVHWRWKRPQGSSPEQALVAHPLRVRLLAKASEVHVPVRVKVGHNARWQGRRAKRRRCFSGHSDSHVARPASCHRTLSRI